MKYNKKHFSKRLAIILLVLMPLVVDASCTSKKKGIRRGKAIPCPFKNC